MTSARTAQAATVRDVIASAREQAGLDREQAALDRLQAQADREVLLEQLATARSELSRLGLATVPG